MAAVPRLQLLCVPVRRIERSRLYNSKYYEIGLLPSSGKTHKLVSISAEIGNEGEDFHRLIWSYLKENHQLSALSIHSVTTLSNENCTSILFIIPTMDTGSDGEASGSGIRFIDIFSFMQSPHLLQSQQDLLLAIDQWLKERHSLPYSNPDLLFSTDSNGRGLVGIVQDIVHNPLLSVSSEPPEDKLVIGLNNPVFIPIEQATP